MIKSTKLFAIVLCVALFATILGEKLRFIDKYGSDLPFWDQWDAEGDNLYRPYVENRLTAKDLFAPHNEHRIFFTRVLSLALFEANDRQWDARIELLVNAVLHAVLAILLVAFALKQLPSRIAAAFAVLTAVFFTTCVSFENTLAGFQSQLYLLLLFSALHIGGTLLTRPRSLAWWCAPLAGFAGLFSMGSGLLSAAAILVTLTVQVSRERKLTHDDIWVLTTNLVLCAIGWFLKVEVSYHESLKAAGFLPWLTAWMHQLSWPVKNIRWAPLGLFPPIALALAYCYRRLTGPTALVLLAACIWAGLQTAAIAYARGAVENGFAPRYTDILAITILINFIAIAFIATNIQSRSLKLVANFAAAALVGVSLWGLNREEAFIDQGTLSNLPAINNARVISVRNYISSHDSSFFSKTPWTELPYPSAERLAGLLDVPSLRQILPCCVRPPVAIGADSSATEGFSEYRLDGQLTPPPRPLAIWLARPNDEQLKTNHFTSLPFSTEHSLVGLFMASGDSQCEVKLSLINEKGLKSEPLGKDFSVGPKWKRINFNAPAGQYRLEITAQSASWFAFTQPMTDTQLSHFGTKAVRLGPWFLGLGMGFVFAALVLLILEIKNGSEIRSTTTA